MLIQSVSVLLKQNISDKDNVFIFYLRWFFIYYSLITNSLISMIENMLRVETYYLDNSFLSFISIYINKLR